MPLGRSIVKGLVYTIDLTKIADRANPRTVEAPIYDGWREPVLIDFGDGNTLTASTGSWITHTYAEGAGDVFTVVIRSATGHLPRIKFSNETGPFATPTKNITLAVTSVDHFAGWSGTDGTMSGAYILMHTSNLSHADPRLICFSNWNTVQDALATSGITQSVESFCFDFSVARNASYLFYNCSGIYGTPKDFLAKNYNITSLLYAFHYCTGLTGEPFVFWNEDGTIDTSKYPDLASAGYCYTGCSAAMRAQVPTAYGGTMTVG